MKPPKEGVPEDKECNMACNHGDTDANNPVACEHRQKEAKKGDNMDQCNNETLQEAMMHHSGTDDVQEHLETPQEHLEIPQEHLETPQKHLQTPQEHLETAGDEDYDEGIDEMDTESSELTLLTLPSEILWGIISFLDTRFVITQLSLVCRQLYDLLNDDVTWKVRISKRWPNRYPIIQVDENDDSENFNWKLACIQREEQYRLWSDHKNTMDFFRLEMGHIGPIDTVHLMQEGTICISGSRDRTIQIWDLTKLDAANPRKSVAKSKVKSVPAHKGWVWHVTSLDNIAVTSSWDCWLKLWDINRECTEISRFKGKSAMLSTVILPDRVMISGSYDKLIYIHDPRADTPLVDKLLHHTKPVLSIAADSQHIISASEDGTIAIYNRRAHKIFKQIELASFPMCMSYGFNQLWTGQKDGTLNVLDPTHGNFDIVETYASGHKGKLTDVIHNLGSLITCSTDKTIKVHEPNHNPAVITTHSDFYCDIASLSLQNNVLASAGSDGAVGIWKSIL